MKTLFEQRGDMMRLPWTRLNAGRPGFLLSVAGLVAVLAVRPDGVALRAQGNPPLPAAFDSFIKSQAKLTADEHQQLLAGRPVTQHLETDPATEVAVFGAVWVNAPMADYLSALRDIESFEKSGNFLVTKRISEPPRLADFDRLSLPPDDIADLKNCKVGDCEVKLGEAALTRIQKETDWSKPTATADVERSIRRLVHEYVTGYLEGGNTRLAVYRDAKRPTFVAKEFAAMVDGMPFLTSQLPDLKKYLLDYPNAKLPNAESFLYWQNVKFGLKPTIRINHVTIADQPSHVAVASKMLFASHYFWTAIELRVLVPDRARGEGFWFANVNRSRSDGLSGFAGSLIRGKVQAEAEQGMEAALAIIKQRMER
jgi:hypothetical protein